MHPPGTLLVPRQSMQNVQVQEYYVPAKTRVLINALELEGIPNHGMHLMSFGRRDLWKSLVNLVVLIFSSSHSAQAGECAQE